MYRFKSRILADSLSLPCSSVGKHTKEKSFLPIHSRVIIIVKESFLFSGEGQDNGIRINKVLTFQNISPQPFSQRERIQTGNIEMAWL